MPNPRKCAISSSAAIYSAHYRANMRTAYIGFRALTPVAGLKNPAIPRYSAEPLCVDRDTRDRDHCNAIHTATKGAGFFAEVL